MKRTLLLISLIMVSFLLVSCSFLSEPDETLVIPSLELQNLSSGFSYIETIPMTAEEAGDTVIYDEDYEVSYEQVTATTSYDDLSSFGVNNDVMYPGALIDYKTLDPIQAKRNPITISMSLETATNTGSSSLSRTISNPKLSSVRDEIKSLVSDHITETTNLPSRITYEVREIHSEDEFGLNLGFALQNKKFGFSDDFSLNKINKQTNIVIILKQIYYTIDVDVPDSESEFFNLSNAEINDIMDKGVIPTYVSSVSYGRIAIVSIQTNFSRREIENELAVSWGKMSETPGHPLKSLSMEFDSTLKLISRDDETTIKAFIYGGSSQSQHENLITSASTFSISSIFGSYNAMESVGVPLQYTLRHLDGSLAKLQETNQYVIKNIEYKPKKIMNWEFYNTLVESEEIRSLSEFTVDVSSVDSGIVNQTIVIPANIEKITFYGDNDITTNQFFSNLSLKISNRSTPLEVLIQDFSFSANDYYAIFTNSLPNLKITFQGEVEIIGATGYDAIKGPNITITGDGDITIRGGDGHDYERGFSGISCDYNLIIETSNILSVFGGNGGRGRDGVSYDRTSIENNKLDGRDGGNGEMGYSGGNAIEANAITINTQNSLRLTLSSGDGGRGGHGGDGEFASFRSEGDKTAGDGGDGGNGGQNGYILLANELIINGMFMRLELIDGYTGDGGNGGDGGHADQDWFIVLIDESTPGEKGFGGSYGGDHDIDSEQLSILLNHVLVEHLYQSFDRIGSSGVDGVKGDKDYIK